MAAERDRSDESQRSPEEDSASSSRRTFTSEQLLQGAREVLIEHGGDVYRLRVTRSGKLILHK